jgi:hypothetical protein
MTVIPATQEAEVERSQSKASPAKLAGDYLKNKLKAKGVGAWPQMLVHLPSNLRLWVQSPVLQKKKKKKKKNPLKPGMVVQTCNPNIIQEV